MRILMISAMWIKRLCLGLLIINLVACSAARLGYNNGETLSYWWLNGYVGFDNSQRPWIQERIDKLFAWHRATQLRDYVKFLTASQQLLQHEVNKGEVLADYETMTNYADRVIDQAAPDAADFVLSMDADNIKHLQDKFESNNEHFRKEYLRGNREDQQEHRYKLVMDWAEYWFGSFSSEQEAVIRRASDQRPLNNELWAADRIQRQQGLMTLLKQIQQEKPPREKVIEMVKSYVGNNYLLRAGASPEMKTFFETSKDGVAQLAVVIINLTTPKQKEYARQKLQQWIDDFNTLAAKK